MEELKDFYCSSCGALIGGKDLYCKECGNTITIYDMKDIDDTSYICKTCRTVVTLGKSFCSKCGAKINWNDYIDLKRNEHLCRECGYISKKEDNYCSRCGTAYDLDYIYSEPKEKRIEEKAPLSLNEKKSLIEIVRNAINNLRPLKKEQINTTNETKCSIDTKWKNSSKESIRKVNKIIETLFEELNYCYVTESKILGRLFTFDENLVKELDLNINNIKDFIKSNYDYYYLHPFIGKKEIISPKKMVAEYFNSKDIVNHQMILDFFYSIGYSNHKSYKIYFDELVSSGFYRIDDEIVASYDSLDIEETTLETIKSNIDYYFENTSVMDTSKLNRYYFMLPKIKYTWNSYVLVFVLKKYYSDEYIISENSDGVNYTIRRK